MENNAPKRESDRLTVLALLCSTDGAIQVTAELSNMAGEDLLPKIQETLDAGKSLRFVPETKISILSPPATDPCNG